MIRRMRRFRELTALVTLSLLLGLNGYAEGQASAPTTRIVTDMTGRAIQVPAIINRIVTAFGPSYETVFLLGGKDKIVATGAMHAKMPLAVKTNPDLAKYPAITALGMATTLNIEEMLKVKPDLVFFWPNPPVLKKLKEAGIGSVVMFSFSLPGNFNSYKDQQGKEILFVGDLLGGKSPAIAAEYCKYYDGKLDYIYGKTKSLTDAQRPKCFVGNSNGSNFLNGWSKDMEENYMDWIAGGLSITANADETSPGGFTQINKEQLVASNPEYLIVDNHGGNTQSIKASIKNDPAFAQLKAIKDNHVFAIPIGVFLMNHCAEKPLYMLWLAKTFQPELFKDLDFNQEMKYFYNKFYNYKLNDQEITEILNG